MGLEDDTRRLIYIPLYYHGLLNGCEELPQYPMPLNAYVPNAHGYKRTYDRKIYSSRQEEGKVDTRFATTLSTRITTAVHVHDCLIVRVIWLSACVSCWPHHVAGVSVCEPSFQSSFLSTMCERKKSRTDEIVYVYRNCFWKLQLVTPWWRKAVPFVSFDNDVYFLRTVWWAFFL